MTRKTITDYAAEIRHLHAELVDYPESETLHNRLSYRLGKWADMLGVVVRVASNEQKPWTEEELGMVTIPMAKKAENGFQQVGDYQFEVVYNDRVTPGGILVERKEVSDLYGTLMRSDERKRFYREISRYESDCRFDALVVMVEGNLDDFYAYAPKFKGKKYVHKPKGASEESKCGTIAGLISRNISVQWCGSREQAVKLYPQMVRQWCIKNYESILELNNE